MIFTVTYISLWLILVLNIIVCVNEISIHSNFVLYFKLYLRDMCYTVFALSEFLFNFGSKCYRMSLVQYLFVTIHCHTCALNFYVILLVLLQITPQKLNNCLICFCFKTCSLLP